MKLLFHSPGHAKNTHAIQQMCKSRGIELIFTHDDNMAYQGNYDILIANSRFLDPNRIPSHIFIIFGPQHFVFPSGPLVGKYDLEYSKRCVFNSLSKWVEKMWLSMTDFKIPIVQFPFTVDLEKFTPNLSKQITIDCVFYVKQRQNNLISTAENIIQKHSLSYQKFVYGSYQENNYLQTLKSCKFMITLDRHESQGFALEEAMACNIPLLVIDATTMYDESNGNNSVYSYLQPRDLSATSVPYWSDDCGIRITEVSELDSALTEMEKRYLEFQPRKYIEATLSPEVCMDRILNHPYCPQTHI